MPNEQTSVPLYAASEVLTAANMNISAGTGVPVFATTVTRDAAFGGASEKVLAEGQLCYLSASNIVQYYDGAAWATVGPAAASGLVFLTAVSFTAQTTVAFANSLFSATYLNYQVFMELDTVSGASNWTMQVRDNAGAKSTADYFGGLIGTAYTGTTVNVGSNGLTAFNFGTAASDCNNIAMTVFNPNNNVRNTTFSGTTFNNNANDLGGAFGGFYKVVGAYTGLQFNFSTTVTGTYRVYGLADS